MSKYGNYSKFPLCPRGIEIYWKGMKWAGSDLPFFGVDDSAITCLSHLCLFGWCYTNLYNFFGSICKVLSSLLLIPCHRSRQLTMPGTMACVLHAVIKQTYGKGNGDVSGDGSRIIRGSEGCRGTISSWSWGIRWMDLTWSLNTQSLPISHVGESMVWRNNTIPSNACAELAACGPTDLEAVAAVAAVVSSGRILKQWFWSSISTSKCCRDWASSSGDISGMRWNRIFIFDVRPGCLISRSSSWWKVPSWRLGEHLRRGCRLSGSEQSTSKFLSQDSQPVCIMITCAFSPCACKKPRPLSGWGFPVTTNSQKWSTVTVALVSSKVAVSTCSHPIVDDLHKVSAPAHVGTWTWQMSDTFIGRGSLGHVSQDKPSLSRK